MKNKVKWPIWKLIFKKQRKIIRIWMRQVESLKNSKEKWPSKKKMVYICKPKEGENIDGEGDERLVEDPKDC
jgi:hypothetical protein